MSVLTFTPTNVVTVTIGADSFRDEATRYAADAATFSTRANFAARAAAPHVDRLADTGWSSAGGASAGEVYSLILSDACDALDAARAARATSVTADGAETAQHAAWAADAARVHRAGAKYAAGNAERLLGYLTAA